MLIEERHNIILEILNNKQSTTVKELVKILGTSEATIRRDLSFLGRKNKLTKVHGGATSINGIYTHVEENLESKIHINTEDKIQIARKAGSLINENDLVYIDSGSSTQFIADFVTCKTPVFVTNSVSLAKNLCKKGYNVNVLAGRVKQNTEAIVGHEAMKSIARFNFTIGFFGTNGISVKEGFTTPDIDEANIKSEAISRCSRKIILSDANKFNKVSSVTFADLSTCSIITTKLSYPYFKKYTSIEEICK